MRIGTRGSALALWQARTVAQGIRQLTGAPKVEEVIIKTQGDRIIDRPLSTIPGKGFFTKELENALLDETVDLAVHSLKDLATEMPDGLDLGAVLIREDPRDVLLSRLEPDLHGLAPGSCVGTGSLRRRALLARARPDLVLKELRGNVPTRIGKLRDGDYDAIVLAAAGVKRLGLEKEISSFLPVDTVLPAVAQGAVAVQIRKDDSRTREWIAPLNHAETQWATEAERALMRRLEGGCKVPVGALGRVQDSKLSLVAVVCSLDGKETVEGRKEGPLEKAEQIGDELAGEMLSRGAEGILEEIRRVLPDGGE